MPDSTSRIPAAEAADHIPFQRLLQLGLPFVIRSPESCRGDTPDDLKIFDLDWESSSFWRSRWIIQAWDHERREHYCGSGLSASAAFDDFAEGLAKAGRPVPPLEGGGA